VRKVQDHPVYAAMVEHMDAAVGVVLDAIEQAGLAESTLVIFTSDNGGLSTAEGHPTSNLPLRAGKGWLYEGGIRVPLIVRWPGAPERSARLDAPVFSGDVYPTLLDWAGLPLRPEQHLDGQSLGPLLRGETKAGHDKLFWHYPHYGNQGGTPSAAIRQGDWKLILYFEDKLVELFNLASDPEESKDLMPMELERTFEMFSRLEAWQKEVGARNPTRNPAAAQTP
jgi:arylsulfatase A-like enzyme